MLGQTKMLLKYNNVLGYIMIDIIGVFTSTGVTGYKGIRVTFLHLNTLQKVTLIPRYPGAREYP